MKLTPPQKSQLSPIVEEERAKLKEIESNPSLTGAQKMEQLKAVHDQTDPTVRAVLTPKQYEQWQAIRQSEIQRGVEKKKEQ